MLLCNYNSAVAWSQVQDVKGGGLCVSPAPTPRKKTIATETDTEKKHANGARGETSQETEEMKAGSQTRLAADISMADLLTPKYKIRVGSWNVRTLYQAGKLQQVLRQMTNYKVEILCVSGARWTVSGRRILASGHTIFYSGRTDNLHRGGVAVIVTRKVENILLEWKPVNDRFMKVRFNSKFAKLTIIACYAPTEEAEEEEKDEFYEQLEEEIRTTPRHDVLMVIRDLNARVGEDNTRKERAMGTQGFGCANNNGERLSDLCVESRLVIGGTLFIHRDINKTTWRSPDQRTVSQIDHVIINQKWRRALQDVKANRGADIGSDHVLVVASVSLKLRKTKRGEKRQQRFDTAKLKKYNTEKAFKLELKNRFHVLQEEQEMNIDSFNQVLTETSKSLLGYRKNRKEEWIKTDTWKTIDERKETKKKINDTKSERIKNQLQTRYSTLDKEVKRKTKADKRAFIENLADEAKTAAQMQNMATLYKITKALAGGFKNCDIPMKDADGVVITSVEEQTQLWKTHFETILNKEAPREVEDIPERDEDLLVNMDPPTANEVKSAIDNMKSGKAPGADGVSAEMLKAGGDVITETLTQIFKEIWEEEEIAVDWKTGLIVKLPKKGNLSLCKN